MTFNAQEFFDTTFEDQDLFEKELTDKIFDEVEFITCDFSQTDLRHSAFNNCAVINSNFCMPLLDGCSFNSIEFKDCKITGVLFSLLKQKLLLKMNFDNCIILNCDFSGLPLKGTIFKDCRISESDFIECDLRNANFSGSNFEKVRIEKSDLAAADFSNCSNTSFNISKNRVKDTKISCEDATLLLEILGVIVK